MQTRPCEKSLLQWQLNGLAKTNDVSCLLMFILCCVVFVLTTTGHTITRTVVNLAVGG